MKHANVTIAIATLLLPLTLLSACTGVQRASNSGSVNAAKYVESNNIQLANLAPEYLLNTCTGFYDIKRFDRTSECLYLLEKSVKQDRLPQDPGSGTIWLSTAHQQAERSALAAKIALDLGQYQQAIKHVHQGIQASESGCYGFNMSGFEQSLSQPCQYEVPRAYSQGTLYGVLAVASTAQHDLNTANQAIVQLENMQIEGLGASWYQGQRDAWLGRAYLATEEYQKAYLTLTGQDRNTLNIINDTRYINPAMYLSSWITGTNFDGIEAFQLESELLKCQALFGLQQWQDSQRCYQAFVSSLHLPLYGNLSFISHRQLGRIAFTSGDYPLASIHLQKAINLMESQRATAITDSQKLGFVTDRQSVYFDMVETQLALKNTELAWQYVERAKARALVDLLAGKNNFEQYPNAENWLQQLHNAETKTPVTLIHDQYDLASTEKLRGLKRQLSEQPEPVKALISPQTVSFQQLAIAQQSHLAEQSLVTFYGQGKSWYAFVVQDNQLTVIPLPLEHAERKVKAFLASVRTPKDQSYKDKAQDLYGSLWQPIENHIKYSQVTIVAHGSLHYLPFAALHDGQEFLMQKHSLNFVPSITVMALLPSDNEAKSSQLLAIGDPELNDESLALVGAKKEAEQIAKLFSNPTILTKQAATETAFTHQAKQADVIHIASHAEFNSDQPLQSRLLLSKDDKNDGFITLSEVYDLSLSADLVTLSACETGLGQLTSGDDVIGLNRGFIFAGSRSVLSSLWKVDDDATYQLMKTYYQTLFSQQNTLNKSTALHYSQEKMLNTQYHHPFYWAGFQLTGAFD